MQLVDYHALSKFIWPVCKILGGLALINFGCWCFKFNRNLNKGGRL